MSNPQYLCSRIIWLGDLNYRIDLPDKETWILVNQCDWKNLLPKDQVFKLKFEVSFLWTVVSNLPLFSSLRNVTVNSTAQGSLKSAVGHF